MRLFEEVIFVQTLTCIVLQRLLNTIMLNYVQRGHKLSFLKSVLQALTEKQAVPKLRIMLILYILKIVEL